MNGCEMTDSICVTINFKLADSDEWHVKQLTPTEYFDLDEGEVVELCCVPHHNHAVDYLEFSESELSATQIRIEDVQTNESLWINETFWDNGKARLIERTDNIRDSPYWELIIELKSDTLGWQIIRVTRCEQQLQPCFHGAYAEDSSGVHEQIIYPKPK